MRYIVTTPHTEYHTNNLKKAKEQKKKLYANGHGLKTIGITKWDDKTGTYKDTGL